MSSKKTTIKKDKSTNVPSGSNNTFFIVAALVLVIITSSIYIKSLKNSFTRWDDDYYVTNNPDIRTLHGDSLNITFKKAMSSYVKGNYHPLTMLSYCIEYNKYKLNPKPYHTTNLILHIVNTLLVFCFIWLLTQQKWVAFITALLFSIHPMHVESVAWVSERKDVLYSFFYLSALCTYLLFLKNENRKGLFYALTFLLFCFGVLSKAMAVSLPIAFFAIDYFMDRKITTKVILEKIPFVLLAFVFGYIAIEAQKSINAIIVTSDYSYFDRFLFTCNALMMYLWKLIAPFNLSCFYDYPIKEEGMYPIIYYIAPFIILTLVFLIYWFGRSKKDVLFGSAFFLITVVLVLQILPVGGAIIADRYTYLPYIGVFFIIARGINNLIESKTEKSSLPKNIAVGALVLFSIMSCYLTIQRCKVWKDSISLWSDAIEKFDGSPQSFNARGDAYLFEKQYEKSIPDFSRAIELKYDYPDAYYNRGLAFYYLGKYEEAIKDYTNAIKYNPKLAFAYYNRAGTYFTTRNYQPALQDALKARELGHPVDPRFIEAIQEKIKGLKVGN